jgi:uncharacterized protein YjbI with pentapeptide repeats
MRARGADFSCTNLSSADLSHADFAEADLTHACLSGVLARNAIFQNAVMCSVHLDGSFMVGANFRDSRLDKATMTNAILDDACLSGARLVGADLSSSSLRATSIVAADLTGACLRYVFLPDADLTDAKLTEAQLDGTVLRRAKLRRADLTGADLTKAALEHADLQSARLNGASLKGSKLQGARLNKASGLTNVRFDENTQLGDIEWGGVQLAAINWRDLKKPNGNHPDFRIQHRKDEHNLIYPRPSVTYLLASTRVAWLKALGADRLATGQEQGSALRSWMQTDFAAYAKAVRHKRCAAHRKNEHGGTYVQGGRRVTQEERDRYREAAKREITRGYREAARAYRDTAAVLQAQALHVYASNFRLREKVMERKALYAEGKRRNWLFSLVLWCVAGNGERPSHTFVSYVTVIALSTAAYWSIAHFVDPDPRLAQIPLHEWIILGITAFHGRGFFPNLLPTPTSFAIQICAAFEAVIGVFIEAIFIATFSRRFLGS